MDEIQSRILRKQISNNARFIILVIGIFWLTLGSSVLIFSLLERFLFAFNIALSFVIASALAITFGVGLVLYARK